MTTCLQNINLVFEQTIELRTVFFILKTLNTKYLFKKTNKIHNACFVDLRKAFDTVWHSSFQYKSMKNNVGSKFFNIIQDMAAKRHEYHLIWKSRGIIVHENKNKKHK